MEKVKISVFARGCGEGRMDRQGSEEVRAVNVFYMTLQLWIHAIKHLSKPIEYNINDEPECKLWTLGNNNVSL